MYKEEDWKVVWHKVLEPEGSIEELIQYSCLCLAGLKEDIPLCVQGGKLDIKSQIMNSMRKLSPEGLSLHWVCDPKWVGASAWYDCLIGLS